MSDNSNKNFKQTTTENMVNADEVNAGLTAEEKARQQFKKQWIILFAVFLVVCVGAIIYFIFIKDDSKVKLGTYKGLTYSPVDTSVTDKEVADEKERLVNSKVSYEKLTDRDGTAAKKGDIVNCSYKAMQGEILAEEGSGNFEIGSGDFTDFENAITGKIIGDTVEICVEIPAEYSAQPSLSEYAGEKIDFMVTLNYVSKKNVPEITDEFVAKVTNNQCESADAFDSYIKEELALKKQSDAEAEIIRELLDKVIKGSEFKDIDDSVQEYYDTMYETYVSAAKVYELDMEEYVKQFYSMELGEFQKKLKDTMVELVKEQLVLSEIIDKENLKLSNERYNTYLEQYMTDYGYTDKNEFIEYYGEESIKESMLYDYAIDFIVENAKPQE